MSDTQLNDNQPLQLDVHTKSSIFATAKIAGIAAILSIAGTIIGTIAVFVNPKTVAGAAKEGFGGGASLDLGGSSIFTVLFSLLLNGILFYYLYRFSKMSKTALQNNQNILLETGLFSLASYFRICAILIIVSIGFMVIALIAVGAGNALK